MAKLSNRPSAELDTPRGQLDQLCRAAARLALLAEAFGSGRSAGTARADLEKGLIFAEPLLAQPMVNSHPLEEVRRALYAEATDLLSKMRKVAPEPGLLAPEVDALRALCVKLQAILRDLMA